MQNYRRTSRRKHHSTLKDDHSSLPFDALVSYDSYMRRNPCILDTSASLLQRQPWIYQLGIMVATAIGMSCASFPPLALVI
jgi:hypothetical protein